MDLNRLQENYFRLHIKCPVCLDKGHQVEALTWKHFDNNCHGDIYVGDNAYYKCMKCGHSAHVSKWKYLCPSHSNSTDAFMTDNDALAPVDFKMLATAMSLSGQMIQTTGLPWFQQFLVNMGEW